MTIEEFQVRKNNLQTSRVVTRVESRLADGEVLARIDAFALTANNITYGVVGDTIGYWNFFPAEGEWGVIPVWGFATVTETRHPEVAEGERLYGYFPMASHLVMAPTKVKAERLVDGAEHRAALPPVYNSYARVEREPGYERSMDDERMLLLPLYATSFCLYDFLLDNRCFEAEQVIVLSASSKTAIGLAYAMRNDPVAPASVGVTSPGNIAKFAALDLYDAVIGYDRPDLVDAAKPAVVVDMSGNGKVVSGLHARLGDNLRRCVNVGVTHHQERGRGPGLPGDRSGFFFAPAHIQKRSAEWGPGAFDAKSRAFWSEAALKSRHWLKIRKVGGAAAVEKTFHELRAGDIPPDIGIVAAL